MKFILRSAATLAVGALLAGPVAAFSVAPSFVVGGDRVAGASATTRLYMGWGPDPIWKEVTVVSNEDASKSCVSVTLKVDEETRKGFEVPGQYCQVAAADPDSKPSFLAVASAPNAESEDEFEFLIKRTENNGWITDVEAGTVLRCSQIMGGGFPIADEIDSLKYDFPTQNVLLFAAGSGIAPIRSAIESGQLGTNAGRTARLYYGVRSPDDVPYIGKFAKWESMGVEVVPVVSQPSENYQGRSGYVQTALEEDGVAIPRNSGALLCGMKGMVESVKSTLEAAGVFEGRMLTNF